MEVGRRRQAGTLAGQAAAVASGEVSPVELVQRALEAIAATEHRFNAFTTVLPERALDEARTLESGSSRGPLHGVPVAVKDLYNVAGVVSSGCCSAYESRVARRDSAVVEALREAGAVIVAKTNQHELAAGGTNLISSYGATRNPWDPERLTGGSSGGSAVCVASRAVLCAMGTDTGGSIRIPASLCGVTGLKPTHGSVSLRGVMPLAPSLDTAGPLSVSAEDCALVWRVICGFDPDDPHSLDGRPADRPADVAGLRVALLRSFLDMSSSDVRKATEQAAGTLADAGCVLDEVEGPDPDESWRALGVIVPAEAAHHHGGLGADERAHPTTRELITLGGQVTADAYLSGLETARKVRRDLEWLLTSADALLAPCTPFAAPRADDEVAEVEGGVLDVWSGIVRLTAPVNLAGLPSLAFPVGLSAQGLPLGAQLIGRPWAEEVLCALGSAYQATTDWHLSEPGGGEA